MGTLRTGCTLGPLETGSSRCTLGALRTLRTGRTGIPLESLKADDSLRTLGSRETHHALGTLSAGCTLGP